MPTRPNVVLQQHKAYIVMRYGRFYTGTWRHAGTARHPEPEFSDSWNRACPLSWLVAKNVQIQIPNATIHRQVTTISLPMSQEGDPL